MNSKFCIAGGVLGLRAAAKVLDGLAAMKSDFIIHNL
jgi:hypothetical protein